MALKEKENKKAMVIDIFGFKKRQDLLKEALKREIQREMTAESRSYLQGWEERQSKEGRAPRVSYTQLEMLYKRESWVRAAIDVIQRTATSNSYRLVSVDEDKELNTSRVKPVTDLLEYPNPDDTFSDVLAEIVLDLHIYGDAYVELVTDKKGNPVALYNIYAPSLRIVVNQLGTILGYIQKSMGMLSSSKPVSFKAEEIVHFRLPNPGNEVYGLSPLESLVLPIEIDLYAQNYNKTFFKNHATPRLHVDLGNCTLPQLKRVREYFNTYFKGTSNAHKTIVTEGGAKINTIGVTPNDMEFLNQRKFSRDEICAVLGVPPMKLGIFEDVNRASSDTADKSFKSDKIIPLQRLIAKKINSNIISKFDRIGDSVKLEFMELDLRDAKEQALIDKINIDSGVVTVAEVRHRRGLRPISESKTD